MMKLTDYLLETRPQFLILTPVCCLVGAASAYRDAGAINLLYLIIAVVGALAAHAAVNVLNDYHDFTSGLDLLTTRTPFSGGSGFIPNGRLSSASVLILGLFSLGISIAVGVFFLVVQGSGLLLVGLPGILLIVLYTKFITRSPILCLIAPGLGFGPCMVMGTYFILQGSYSMNVFIASLVPFFLVSNLLLLNQFPDLEADRITGRRHLLILFGKSRSAVVYAVIAMLTYLTILVSVFLSLLPPLVLISLLTLPLAISTIKGVFKSYNQLPDLIPYLGRNVAYTLLTPFLMSIALFIK